MSRFGKLVIIVFVWLILSDAASAQAVGNIHFGKLEMHPYLFLQEIFNDNIYATSNDPKSDRIAETTPGVQFQFPFGLHKFEADYHADIRRYETYKGEDTEDHFAEGTFELYFGSRLLLKLDNTYVKDHEERGVSATGFIDVYRKNSGSAELTYQLPGRSKLQADYAKTKYNFMIADFRDREEDLVSGYLYYRVLPKTSAFIELDRRVVNFQHDITPLDNTMDYFLIGFAWEATAKSKGTFKAGQVRKNFKNVIVNDYDTFVMFIDVDHHFSDYTSVLLKAMRDVNETNYLGTAYYVTTGFTAEVKHRFGIRLAGLARSAYGKDHFSNAVLPSTTTRIDKTITEGVGARYSIRDWLEIGIDYDYNARNSNIDVNDHREHQSILTVNMVF